MGYQLGNPDPRGSVLVVLVRGNVQTPDIVDNPEGSESVSDTKAIKSTSCLEERSEGWW